MTKKTRRVLDYITAHRDELSTPLYLYNELALNKAVAAYRKLFPDNAKLFYSLKANPQPGIVQHLSNLGIGAEITGQGEWDIGVAAGSSRLLAGGTQFGLSPEQGLSIAQAAASLAHIEFLGLHFYFGSQRLSVAPIIQAIDVVEETFELFHQANLDIKIVDLGLGCGVPYLAKDAALDISALRQQLWLRWQSEIWSSIEIWAEAGRALVASAGYFVARVTDKKRLHGKTFVFLDGGLNVHNPGVGLGRFFRSNPVFLFITTAPDERVETIDIVGNLCTSADCFGQNVEAPRLEQGD
ncbi:Orn/DAP/Arg decarboxylase 2, partial [Candidatus Thiomargarita nelsonii]